MTEHTGRPRGPFLRTPEAAAYLGISKGTLYNLVSADRGPRMYKLGRLNAFYPRDLDVWLDEHLTEG